MDGLRDSTTMYSLFTGKLKVKFALAERSVL